MHLFFLILIASSWNKSSCYLKWKWNLGRQDKCRYFFISFQSFYITCLLFVTDKLMIWAWPTSLKKICVPILKQISGKWKWKGIHAPIKYFLPIVSLCVVFYEKLKQSCFSLLRMTISSVGIIGYLVNRGQSLQLLFDRFKSVVCSLLYVGAHRIIKDACKS